MLLDGAWFNVDPVVNDFLPDVPGRALHSWLLVDDSVSRQRYAWEQARYPAAVAPDNFLVRQGLVAHNPEELAAVVDERLRAGETLLNI